MWALTSLLVSAQAPAQEPIALESLYGHPKFWSEGDIPVTISPDGARVAYVIREVPPGIDAKVNRWTKTGAPNNASGAQVYISDTRSGQMQKICANGGYTWRPAWSPDSRVLALYSDAGGKMGLWLYDVSAQKCRQVSDAIVKPKIWLGDEAQWSPDGKTVYVPLIPEGEVTGFEAALEAEAKAEVKSGDLTLYVSAPENSVAGAKKPVNDKADPFMTAHFRRDNNAAVGAIEVASGNVKVLAAAASVPPPSVMRVSPSGSWVSYLSVMKPTSSSPKAGHVMTLAVVASNGGPVHVVAEDLPMTSRDYYRLNYVWHPTEDSLVFYRNGELHRVDLDASGVRQSRRIGTELGQLAPDVYLFTRDGSSVVARIAPGKSAAAVAPPNAATLALIPWAGGQTRQLAFDPARWVYQSLIAANARTAWQPDGESLSVRLKDAKTGETAIVRLNLRNGAQRELWRGRASIQGLSAAADGKDLFGAYEDIATPSDVYRFSPTFVRGKRLSRVAQALDEVKPPRIELFTTRIPLYDHSLAEVRTVVVMPANAKPGVPVPGVVTFYPGADASAEIETFGGGNLAGVPALALVTRGYAVIYPHVKLGNGGQAGNVIDEIVDGLMPQVYGAIQRGYVDATRLALQGNSFGGFGTVAVVTQTQLFRAAVPTNGVYDLVGNAYRGATGTNITWTENSQPRLGASLWDAPLRYIDNSPLFFANKIQTPLLIMQGGDDSLRPEAEKLFAALKRLNKPAELAIYEKSGHWLTIWPRAQAIAATQRILDFYQKNLSEP